MLDTSPVTIAAPTTWTDDELAAQFRLCEQWQDADQWKILGNLYHQKYPHCMNAGYCWRKCDELWQYIGGDYADFIEH
jgi:hypothetical protein